MTADKQAFDSNFEIILADTESGKNLNYQIRYQVFCEEMGFADHELFPEKMEYDTWDQYAVHFLVRDRYTGEWIGAMRLVHQTQAGLPFHQPLNLAADKAATAIPQAHAVELSRLCVLKSMRRYGLPKFKVKTPTAADITAEHGNVTHLRDLRITQQSILRGLYRAAAGYAKKNRICHIYTSLSGALAKQIRQEGIPLQQIPATGAQQAGRTAYQLKVKDILTNKTWEHDYKQGLRLYSSLVKDTELKQAIN